MYKVDKNNDLAKVQLLQHILGKSRVKTARLQSRQTRFNASTKVIDVWQVKQNECQRINRPYHEATQNLRRCSISPSSQNISDQANLQKVLQCEQIRTIYDNQKFQKFPTEQDLYDGKLIKELYDLIDQQSENQDHQSSNLRKPKSPQDFLKTKNDPKTQIHLNMEQVEQLQQ